jgi:ABC-2 type transport system permease protein
LGDVVAVVKNEWMKLKHRKRILVVLVISFLMLCALTGLSYIDSRNFQDPLYYLEQDIKHTEEELRNWESRSQDHREMDPKENIETRLADSKKAYEYQKEFQEGDWREVLQKEKKDLEAKLQNPTMEKRDKSDFTSQLAQINYHLDNDSKPLRGMAVSPSNEIQKMSPALVMLFVPFLVIFLVADMVSGETASGTIKLLLIRPISRFKILLGKWIVSMMAAVFFTVLFYVLLWGMLSILYGFSTGAFEPQWLNVTTEIKEIVDQYGNVQKETNFIYDDAYIVPTWLYIIYTIGMASLAMILIATLAFFCTVIFKTVIMSTGVAFVIVVVGMVLNMILLEKPQYSTWLFTSHLDLMQHWSGLMSQTSLWTGIGVLGIWLVAAIVPAFYVFTKRDVFNA